MRCFTRAAVVALCAALAVVPLRAITYGFIDTANAFPNAGAFIVQSPTTGQIFPICSGTLIRSGVFLTASHCTAYFEQELVARGFTAWVSFDSPIPFGAFLPRRHKPRRRPSVLRALFVSS